MSRSVLRYRHEPPASIPDAPTIVLLHDHRGGMDDLIQFARAVLPGARLVAPEAARGVYHGIENVARTWFGGTLERPEPASFGDSLAQVEQLVVDLRTQFAAAPAWLVGMGQGAVLALALASIAPDLIDRVIAIDGCLPEFAQPGLLPETASSLPVLLVHGQRQARVSRDAIDRTLQRLDGLGLDVTTLTLDDAAITEPELADAVRAWLPPRLL